MKRCVKCEETKTEEEFYVHRQTKDGRSAYCKLCVMVFENPKRNKRRRERWNTDAVYKARLLEGRREKERLRMRNRRRNDPGFRMACNVSRQISLHLNGKKGGQKWEGIVGYSIYELKRHLESMFLDGMGWGNYGRYGWVIDHIIPKAAFDYNDPAQFKKCWSLDNLQPLWFRDNASKRDSLSWSPNAAHH